MTRQPAARDRPPPPQRPPERAADRPPPLEAEPFESDLGEEQPAEAMQNGQGNAPLGDGKVTDDMLARYMESRKRSPATASQQATMQ